MTLHLKCPTYYNNVGDIIAEPIARHFLTDDLRVIRRTPIPVEDQRLLNYPHKNLLLVGSIATWADERSHLCGVGVLKPNDKMHFMPQQVHAVRGPLTRQHLLAQGVKNVPEIYGDPGVLLPYALPMPDIEPVHEYGLIPHYSDKQDPVLLKAWHRQGAHLIDVFLPPEQFLRELLSCRVIFSSSLHGIILAHAYGRPALWIRISDRVVGEGFKFFDYYESVGIPQVKVDRASGAEWGNIRKLAARAQLPSVEKLQNDLKVAIDEVRKAMNLVE